MKSLFSYAGGKFHLIKTIKEIYERSNKTAFIDVFGGSGKVLMNVDSKIKVYNDLDNRLINIFETVRNDKDLLKNKFNYSINSRTLFYDYKLRTSDNIENAYRDIYKYLLSFSGKYNYYGYSAKSNNNTLVNIKDNIDRIYDEVKNWTIENLDYKDLIRRYDSDNSFFYLDPPYYKINFYRYNFVENDFYKLKDIIDNIT